MCSRKETPSSSSFLQPLPHAAFELRASSFCTAKNICEVGTYNNVLLLSSSEMDEALWASIQEKIKFHDLRVEKWLHIWISFCFCIICKPLIFLFLNLIQKLKQIFNASSY